VAVTRLGCAASHSRISAEHRSRIPFDSLRPRLAAGLVDPHIDRVFSTVLAFDVHGAPDAVTRIRVRTGALESELGERIGLDLPGAVETRIGPGG